MQLLLVLHGQDWYDYDTAPYIEHATTNINTLTLTKVVDKAQKRVDAEDIPWAKVLAIELSINGPASIKEIFFRSNPLKQKVELNKEAKRKTAPSSINDFIQIQPYAVIGAVDWPPPHLKVDEPVEEVEEDEDD